MSRVAAAARNPHASSKGRNKVPREFRNLANLGETASTSRILNLARVAAVSSGEDGYNEQPFFRNPQLNKAIIVKHTLRSNENDLFDRERRTATKIILPFDANDLRLGGSTIFIGQRGFREFCREFFSSGSEGSDADIRLLNQLDEIPSLDPFLLREYIGRQGFKPAPCYLKIAPADVERMVAFANEEIAKLVKMAFGAEVNDASVKLASKILSHDLDRELDPLKMTLKLSDAEFSDGIFSWRGFLYFKWRHLQLHKDLISVTRGLMDFRPHGFVEPALAEYLTNIRLRMIDKIFRAVTDLGKTLRVYDDAYDALVRCEDASLFRQFLLDGPALFFELGEGLAVLDHISSFWNYRMAAGKSAPRLDGVEYAELLADFDESLSSICAEEDAPLLA
ncbi:hypothetical protein [Asticcacaulis solisilvae]|uniref:hypothetical protein n=1 Tax=Asticcacaulis solisilvae TaxID=1217274 RepID=UPI003FD6DA6A